jgi:hypothetical protein
VVVGEGQPDVVVEQLLGDEEVHVLLAATDVGALVGERHRQVALPGLEGCERLRRLGLGERHLHVGEALLHEGEGAGDQGRRARGKGHEPHAPGPQPGDGGDLLLGGVEGGEHGDGVPGEHLPSLGEADVATDTFDEDGAGALLEAANHLRDRGLGVAEREGRSGEAALVGDGLHHAQAGGIDHASRITRCYRKAEVVALS